MAETVIMETQTLTFAEDSIYGKTAMMAELSDNNLLAAIGVPFKVTWDGAEYTVNGQYVMGFMALGNLSIFDTSFPDTGEPFLIGGEVGYFTFVSSDAEATTHSIGITVDIDPTVFEPIYGPVAVSEFTEATGGVYIYQYFGTIANITQGKTYFVYWDHVLFKVLGESYELVISETESFMLPYLGDIGLMAATGNVPEGTDGSGEPFCIYVASSEITGGTPQSMVVTNSSGSSHYVGIFAVATNVVLKDRNGQPTEYAGVKKIKVNMSDGTTSLWIDETTVPTPVATEVELNLANGNQTITPSSGQVFNSVEIIKPADLLPGNILKNKNIGGVLGTYEAPEEMTVTITPDFSGGNITEVPETGKVFNEVIVVKPETLLDQNIKKNVAVAGITGGLNYIETVTTASGMDAVLVEENEGNVYKYTGATTDNYTSGDIYIVEAVT